MLRLSNTVKTRFLFTGFMLMIILLSPTLISCTDKAEFDKAVSERDFYWRGLMDANGKITELTANNEQLTNQITQLNNEKQQLSKEKDSIYNELQNANFKLSEANSRVTSLTASVDSLTEAVTPSPDHSISFSETQDNPDFMSVTWKGKSYEWQEKVRAIGKQYDNSHTYIANETDCNDMAVDIWNMLFTQGIKSVIVIGSLENPAVTFKAADHTWLYVFDCEAKYIVLEPTTGEVFFKGDAPIEKYQNGWIYKKPSDLWQDLKKKW